MSTPSPRSAAGGAHYHALTKATAHWETFRKDEETRALHTAQERARNDERRADADQSAHTQPTQ